MVLYSCDHDDFIVVYEGKRVTGCPVCEMETAHVADVEDLKSQIANLEEGE